MEISSLYDDNKTLNLSVWMTSYFTPTKEKAPLTRVIIVIVIEEISRFLGRFIIIKYSFEFITLIPIIVLVHLELFTKRTLHAAILSFSL